LSLKAFNFEITASLATSSNWPSDTALKVPMNWFSMTLPPVPMGEASIAAGSRTLRQSSIFRFASRVESSQLLTLRTF
jgi:hypothetical protein